MKINFEFDTIDEMMEFAAKLGSKEEPKAAVNEGSAHQDEAKPAEPKAVKSLEPAMSTPEPAKSEVGPAEKTYTLADVREKLAELQKSGKREEVKALINSFGAQRLPDVPEDKYAELMKKAGEL